MASPGLAPIRRKDRQWCDFTPDYGALLNFVDVFYGAVLGYGIYCAAQPINDHLDGKPFDSATFALVCFSLFYLVGDYVDSRLFTAKYHYQSLWRFAWDLGIAIAFFGSFIAANHAHRSFFLIMAIAFGMGSIWCWQLDRENAFVKPLKWPWAAVVAHAVTAIVFVGLWNTDKGVGRLNLQDALRAPKYYFAWAGVYVLLEIIIGIPAREADLFPNFPLGRILRSMKVTETVRHALIRVGSPVIGGVLHWGSMRFPQWSKNWDRKMTHPAAEQTTNSKEGM